VSNGGGRFPRWFVVRAPTWGFLLRLVLVRAGCRGCAVPETWLRACWGPAPDEGRVRHGCGCPSPGSSRAT